MFAIFWTLLTIQSIFVLAQDYYYVESEEIFEKYEPIYSQEDLKMMNVVPATSNDIDIDICKHGKFQNLILKSSTKMMEKL